MRNYLENFETVDAALVVDVTVARQAVGFALVAT